MTNFTKKMMIAAAAVVVASGVASAQTMKAEIPFTFQAGKSAPMAAGTYHISSIYHATGTAMFRLASEDGHTAILLVPNGAGDPKAEWEAAGNPLLNFECGANRCALVGLWTGARNPAYRLSRPKAGAEEPMRTAVVAMRPEKGD